MVTIVTLGKGYSVVTVVTWGKGYSVVRGLPLITYAPRGRGGVKASYTFPLRITCKKGGRGSR